MKDAVVDIDVIVISVLYLLELRVSSLPNFYLYFR